MQTTTITRSCFVCDEPAQAVVTVDERDRWMGGALAQDVWPDMSDDLRELIVSGTHAPCWKSLFDDGI